MTKSQFKLDIPDGTYSGIWTGNVAHLTVDGERRSFTTVERNGGFVSRCNIEVKDGIATIKLDY